MSLNSFPIENEEKGTEWCSWKPVIGGFLIHAVLGTLHCFGNMVLYSISYMRMHGDIELRLKDASWIYASCVIGQGLFGFLGGRLEARSGPRIAAMLGGTLLCGGYALSYYTVNYFPWFLLSYGVLCGIGAGLAYPVPLACALRALPSHKATVSGIIFLGRAVGVVAYAPFQTWLVNPGNVPPEYLVDCTKPLTERYYVDPGVLSNVPRLFLYSSYLLGAIFILGALLLDENEDKGCESIEETIESRNFKSRYFGKNGMPEAISIPKHPMSAKEIFCSCRFWHLWFAMLLSWQSVAFIQTFWKAIGYERLRISDHHLTLVGAIAYLLNSVGRVGWGIIGDSSGSYRTTAAMHLMLVGGIAMLPFVSQFEQVYLFAGCICLIFTATGGAFALFPSITAELFGITNFASVFGLLFSARAISSLLTAIMVSAMMDIFTMDGICYLVSASAALSLVLLCCLPQRHVAKFASQY